MFLSHPTIEKYINEGKIIIEPDFDKKNIRPVGIRIHLGRNLLLPEPHQVVSLTVAQDLKYKGEPSELLIGNRNTIREYVSLNPGTTAGGMVTRVGDQNLLMMQCHIAHDCLLGDRNVVANGATLGGHVMIEDFVIVGGLVGIHQFVRIGTGAILGAGSMVSKDVPPYCNATGDRAKLHGLNLEGLKRRGFDKTVIALLRKAYRIVFQSALRTEDALKKIREELPAIPEIEKFASFIAQSGRGVCR